MRALNLFHPSRRVRTPALAVALVLLTGAGIVQAPRVQAQQMAPAMAWVEEPTPLQSGPDDDYPNVAELQPGDELVLYGCLEDVAWCDVAQDGMRGWVHADDIWVAYHGERVDVGDLFPHLGLPIIFFDLDTYWGHWYIGRPWFSERKHWDHWDWHHGRSWHQDGDDDRRDGRDDGNDRKYNDWKRKDDSRQRDNGRWAGADPNLPGRGRPEMPRVENPREGTPPNPVHREPLNRDGGRPFSERPNVQRGPPPAPSPKPRTQPRTTDRLPPAGVPTTTQERPGERRAAMPKPRDDSHDDRDHGSH